MTLQEELNQLNSKLRKEQPAEVAEVFDRSIKELKEQDYSGRAKHKGDNINNFKLPNMNPLAVKGFAENFKLPNAVGVEIELKQLLAKGPVVINFYRGGWCPYCNLELKALQRRLPEIKELGGQLIAISPESPDNSMSTAEKHKLTIEVLSDLDNKVAKQFGIVFEVPDYLIKTYKSFGLDLSHHNNSEKWELPMPATFVISQQGEIVFSYVNEDYITRANIDDILEALRKIN